MEQCSCLTIGNQKQEHRFGFVASRPRFVTLDDDNTQRSLHRFEETSLALAKAELYDRIDHAEN